MALQGRHGNQGPRLCLSDLSMMTRLQEADVDKVSSGATLRSDPSVRVSSRAHKMSKSRGNVVNPDEIVESHGADSLRLFEMFLGPLQDTKVLVDSRLQPPRVQLM